jgi:hypothetical protein
LVIVLLLSEFLLLSVNADCFEEPLVNSRPEL